MFVKRKEKRQKEDRERKNKSINQRLKKGKGK